MERITAMDSEKSHARVPFQGVENIVRFNRHFYILSGLFISGVLVFSHFIHEPYCSYLVLLAVLVSLPILVSLAASLFIYDLSGLYSLNWLDKIPEINTPGEKIVNINAGFDETSILLHAKYPLAELTVFDFYDPEKHTEISIRRARAAYPSYKDTRTVSTSNLPLADGYAHTIFVIFAAHEIRDEQERVIFFRELARVLEPAGQIIVTEHLRDLPNFLAYNIGFFHFFPRASWRRVFTQAGLAVRREKKNTPFLSTFILNKHE